MKNLIYSTIEKTRIQNVTANPLFSSIRKILVLAFLGMMVGSNVFAGPVSSYIFTSSAGTFTTIKGTVGYTSPAGSPSDDTQYGGIPIGFTFNYDGTNFTTMTVQDDGNIGFNGGNTYSSPLSVAYTIAVMGRDGIGSTTYTPPSSLGYVTTGCAPNRIFTVEWTNYHQYSDVGTNWNAQIKLYEGSNVVQIIYGSCLSSATAYVEQIGLSGATPTTDFNCRATTTDWTATTAGGYLATCAFSTGIIPPTGLTYTWVPPTTPACVAPVDQATGMILTPTVSQISGSFTAAASTPSGYLVVGYLSGATPTNPVTGTIYSPGQALGSGIVVQSTCLTTFTAPCLAPNTAFDFYVYSYNSNACFPIIYNTASPLMGTGTTLAIAQPTGLSLTAISTSQINGSFTAASPASDGYLVVRYPAGATPVNPTNGTIYTAGTALGTGKVVIAGTYAATSPFSATGLFPNTSYDFYVYSYSCTTSPTYFTTSPLFGTLATQACSGLAGGTYSVGPTGVYTTLTAAVSASNGGITGPVIFELQAAYLSSVEPSFPITFNPNPCITPTNSLTIRPEAGANGLIITSATASVPVFRFNGGNYITIDGRPGGVGGAITVPNTTYLQIRSTIATGSAIQFQNESSNNTIQYCDLQAMNTTVATSSALATAVGVVCFNGTTGANGNDNNTITGCDIHVTSGGTLGIGIYAGGTVTTTATYNDNNTITNNNIYDMFIALSATAGIDIAVGNSAWTISGNSIFQTATRTMTSTQTNRGIWLTPNLASLTPQASGFVVTGNYIGGTAPLCGGTAMTLTGATAHLYFGIDLSTGLGTATSVQGNTIQNIAFTTTSASTTGNFIGISQSNGNNNIGTVTGNLIGSTTTVGSILITENTTSGGLSIGIKISGGTGVTNNVANNTICGIKTATGTTSIACNITGILISGSYTNNVTSNTIGSTTLANAIWASQAVTTTFVQSVIGINVTSGTTANTVNNNTIGNLTNSATNTTFTTVSLTKGIQNTSSVTTQINGNTISRLTTNAPNTGVGTSSSIVGISNTGAFVGMTITGNTISGLLNTNPGIASTNTAQITGLFWQGATSGTNQINKNMIYNMGFTAVNNYATLTGIDCGGSGLGTFVNNVVRMGYDASGNPITTSQKMRGITKGVTTGKIWFNSVYVGGSGVGTSPITNNTYAMSVTTINAADDIENNVFDNERQNASTGGFHAAIGVPALTGCVINYNVHYYLGVNGSIFAANTSTLAQIAAAWSSGWFAGDLNSIGSGNNPQFLAPTAAIPNLHISFVAATPVEALGVNIPSVTDDKDNIIRAGFTPVDIGAYCGNYIGFGCTGSPNPGNTNASTNPVCPGISFTLSLQNNPLAIGLTYVWYSSTDNITFNPIAGATNATYTTSQTVETWYYCDVTCGNSGLDQFSNTIDVTMNNFLNCYCTPTYTTGTSGCAYYITNVSISSTNFNSSPPCISAQPYFLVNPATGNNTTTLVAGATYTISASSTAYTGIGIWIDYNMNGIFDPSEYINVSNNNNSLGSPWTGTASFTVPNTIVNGQTRMRVLDAYYCCYPTPQSATTPCISTSAWTYGETEDYILTLAQPVACSGTPTAGTASSSVAQMCQGTATPVFTLTDAYTAATSGISYQWDSAAVAGGPYSPITGATNKTYTANGLSANSYYVCVTTCVNGGGSAQSNEASVLVNPMINASVTYPFGNAFCGTGGTATLNASSADPNYVYTWTGTPTPSPTTGPSVSATVTQTSNYTVTASDQGFSCLSQVSVSVYAFPTITPTATPSSFCNGTATTSTLSANVSSTNFSVVSIPYNGMAVPGTGVTTLCSAGVQVITQPSTGSISNSLDDGIWANQPIGFNFNFFGNIYSAVNVSTNGNLQFSTQNTTYTPGSLPSTSIVNFVAPFWTDLLLTSTTAGQNIIRYWVSGVAPNRIFVLEYSNVNHYSYPAIFFTGQIWLYETTGVVEVHIASITSGNVSTWSTGVNNATGSIGAAAPNRNNNETGSFLSVTTPEAWRFIPPSTFTAVWQPSSLISGSNNGLSVTTVSNLPVGTTTYSVVVTNSVSGCSASYNVPVTVFAVPGPPAVTPPSASVCGTQTVTLSTTPAAGNTMKWYDAATGGNLLFTGNNFTTPVQTGSFTYYAEENTPTCPGSSRTFVTVSWQAPPTVSVASSGGSTFCSGTSTTLSASSGNDPNYTYVWNPGNQTAASITVTPSVNTTYTVVATDNTAGPNAGCAFTATTPITVNPTPVVNASNSGGICGGGSSQLNATVVSGGGSSQVSSYSFSQSTGTFSSIVGTTGYVSIGTPGDDTNYPNTPIGFNFNYDGTVYSTLSPEDDANVNFGSATFYYTSPLATANVIAVVGRDLIGSTGSAEGYVTTGSPGSRIFTYEWTQMYQYNAGVDATSYVNCQLKLYEGSNMVQMIYGPCVNGANVYTCEVGLSGSLPTTDFIDRTTTTDWSATTVGGYLSTLPVQTGILPPSGLIFTFVPNNVTYSWAGPGGFSSTISNPAVTPSSTSTYTVTVTNQFGCTATATTTVNVSTPPTVNTAATNVTCNGASNGSASVTVNGGTANYNYTWSNGSNTSNSPSAVNTVTGLSAGVYSVTITSGGGACTAPVQTITVTEPTALSIAKTVTQISCFGSSDGSITLTVSGGNPGYTYNWSNGFTTASLSGLGQNAYGVTVTDQSGCTSASFTLITQPSALGATASLGSNTTCFGGSNGSATVSASGGTPPYTGAGTITGLTAGSYSFTVTDSRGCTAVTNSVTIGQPSAITATATILSNVSCHNGANGSISVTAAGGNGPYTGTGTFSFLPSGVYTFTVTDANGCTDGASATVTQPATLAPNAGSNTPVCAGTNINLTSSPSGGTAGYSYAWTGPNGFASTDQNPVIASATASNAGTYSLTVTDAHSCTSAVTTTIAVPICQTGLTLKLYFEGYYVGAGSMNPTMFNEGVAGATTSQCDTITVELHSATSPFGLVDTARKVILMADGTTNVSFGVAVAGNSYYIAIKHRNSVQTWSKLPYAFATTGNTYDFSTAASQAFGNNEVEVDFSPATWAIYTGDINQDCNIDLIDFPALDFGINHGLFGYYAADLNGDGNVDLLDFPVLDANINAGIFCQFP